MNIINLTPHTVNIMHNDVETTIEPYGIVARCTVNEELIGYVNDIPVYKTVMGDVVYLPEPKDGVVFIVSRVVAEAAKGRDDLYIPTKSIRDSAGRIIGCEGLGIL